jgi:putative pyruvate formate lyase activating enzyme
MDSLAYDDSSDRLKLYTKSFLELPEASPSLLDLKAAIVDRLLEKCTAVSAAAG